MLKTGAEAKPLPKRPRGRPPGSKNKFSASSREVLEEWGAKITEAACRWAVGKPIVRINRKGQREKVYPSGDQMQTSQKLVLERLVAVRRHTELTGADGKDLVTPKEPTDNRTLARTVLSILSEAKGVDEPAEPPPQHEQLLIGRDDVIELKPVSGAAVSGTPLKGEGVGHGDAPAPSSLSSTSPPVGEVGGEGRLVASADSSPPTHGERIDVVENGAHIRYHEHMKKWHVLDSCNVPHSWKATRERALEFAATLPRGDPADYQPDPFEPARPNALFGEARRDNREPPRAEVRVLRRAPR